MERLPIILYEYAVFQMLILPANEYVEEVSSNA